MKDENLYEHTSEKDKILSEYLVRNGLVKPESLRACLLRQKVTHDNLSLILVQNGCLSHDELVEAMLNITDESLIDEELILPYIPVELLKKHRAMIVAETFNNVYIATLGNPSQCAYDFSKFFPKQEIKFIPANIEKLENYHSKISKIQNSEFSILEKLVRKAITYGSSDIHIVPDRNSYDVEFRILGMKHLDHVGDLDEYNKVSAMIKDRAKMDLAERRIPQDGSYTIEYNGRFIDFRVATIPAKMGEVIVMRILDPEKSNVKLDSLGISNLSAWRKAVSRADGIVLICGVTGSGKTTTLSATIREMDRLGKAIYTAEDPVEYHQPFVRQVNINELVGLDYSAAVKCFMRGDPDCIIIGEIRDLNTARNAIKAAETGHLVIATMHTSSITGSVTRLRDLGIEAHEIKHILRGVLTQKLMRTTCKKCDGSGCPTCMETGFGARTIISECNYFSTEEEVQDLIDGKPPTWKKIIEDAFDKYDKGMTNMEELVRIFGYEAEIMLEKRAAEAVLKN